MARLTRPSRPADRDAGADAGAQQADESEAAGRTHGEEPAASGPEPDAAAPEPEPAAGTGAGEGGEGDGGGGRGTGDGHAPAWRDRRMIVAAVVAVVSLSLATVLALSGRSGGDDAGDESDAAADVPATPSTSMNTGGIDVPTPDGWEAAPVPQLGFGIAYPPGWEAVVLQPEMLNSLTRSDPQVTGFVDAAHAAAASGFVFYAAGEDDQGRVTDLKIRADTGAEVSDVAGLEEYAGRLAAESGVADPEVGVVDDADLPTVRTRFRSTAESEDGERVTTEGIETLVLGPRGIVWSLVVTGEDADLVADLAPRLVATFTPAPA